MTNQKLPAFTKVLIIGSAFLLLQFATVFFLPPFMVLPAYFVVVVWSYALWTGGGGIRNTMEPSTPTVKKETKEDKIARIVKEHQDLGKHLLYLRVDDDGYVFGVAADGPTPHGLSPRWVPYTSGSALHLESGDTPVGEYLPRIEYCEQVELEAIVRKSEQGYSMESDLKILSRLQGDGLPTNRKRVKEYAEMEIAHLQTVHLGWYERSRKSGHERDEETDLRYAKDEKRVQDLIRELCAFRDRL